MDREQSDTTVEIKVKEKMREYYKKIWCKEDEFLLKKFLRKLDNASSSYVI